MTIPSITRIRDALVELQAAELDLEARRTLVAELESFLSTREGNYALQELLGRVNDGLLLAGTTSDELREWRPTVVRLMAAEAERLELENTQRREGSKLTAWLMGAVDARTVLIVLAIIGGALGLRITLPGGISVGQPEPSAVESSP